MQSRSKRQIGALVTAVAVLAIGVGVAATATIVGDEGDNVLTGTPKRDTIEALGGNDTVTALQGGAFTTDRRGDLHVVQSNDLQASTVELSALHGAPRLPKGTR